MQLLSFRAAVLAFALPLSGAHAATPDALSDPLGTIPGDGMPARSQLAPKTASAASLGKLTATAAPTAPTAPTSGQKVAPTASAPALLSTVQAKAFAGPSQADLRASARPKRAPTSPASVPSLAPATTPAPSQLHSAASNVATLRQLDALRSENAVLAEMVKAADLRSKLPAGQSSSQAPAPRITESARASQAAQALKVVSVYGLDGDLTAVLEFATGGIVKVHAGSALPGVGSVAKVSHNEVIVATAAGQYSLNFAPIPAAEH